MLGNHALGSAPIASQGSLPVSVAASVFVNTTTSVALQVNKNLSADVLATNILAGIANANHELQQVLIVEAITSGLLDVVKNNSATLDVTANTTVALDLVKNSAAVVDVTTNVTVFATLTQLAEAAVDATANTNAVLDLSKNIEATTNAVVTSAAVLFVTNNSSASIDVTVTSNVETVSVAKLLQTYTFGRGSVGEFTSRPIAGNNIDFILGGAFIPPDPNNVDFTVFYTDGTVQLDLTNSLSADVSSSASISGNLTTAITADVQVITNATLSLFVEKLRSELQVDVNSNASLGVFVSIESDINATAIANANLDQTIALSSDILVNVEITVGTPVFSEVFVVSNVFALLDINGNTEGSPGGIPVDGFFPPTSVILANHSESANTATYTITADIEDGYTTEILEVYADTNPNNVIELSYNNNIASVYLNTPREVYGMSSTFTVSRTVIPQFDIPFNYNLQLNTTITNNIRGNNFRSNKFFIYGNEAPCFLRDDGAGFITLYEEVEPGLIRKLRDTGKLDYAKGELLIDGLMITGLVESFLEFSATSFNSIVPTTEYFDEKNSLLVQAKTVAFPTGEQVEIYQYSKAEDLIDIYITVIARAYNPLAPEITIDQREAVYKLTVLPDYNLGKDKLQQLLQAA